MKKIIVTISIIIAIFLIIPGLGLAQCSVCTKTAEQLGEKPAQGLNVGILYLMIIPLALAGFIGFRWWKREQHLVSGQ